MKKVSISTFLAGLTFLIGVGPVSAQDDGFKVIPVELYACTYNDGKDSDDLDAVIDKWNEWADDRGWDDYAAWTLTPYYFGPGDNAGLDVIWMGAGKDAVALGSRQDEYMANSGGLNDDFVEVMTCGSHANFASINYKAPPQGATPANSVLTFSDCSYEKGANFAAVGAAMGEWGQHLTGGGSTAGMWNWYPAYGGGGEQFDFKLLQAYENLATLGADYERYSNGRGFVTRGRLLGHLVSCDASRAYLAQSRRFVQLR